MKKITILSKDYWIGLFDVFKLLVKVYPLQVISSLVITILTIVAMYISMSTYGILTAVCYFLGTNILLMTVSDSIETGKMSNSIILHLLFGTSTTKFKFSWWYFIPKIFIVAIKMAVAPLMLIIALIQFQTFINKAQADSNIENL